MWIFTKEGLSRLLFYFGLVSGVLGVLSQRGLLNQVDPNVLVADPVFFFLLGMLLVLGGIYLNTDQKKDLV